MSEIEGLKLDLALNEAKDEKRRIESLIRDEKLEAEKRVVEKYREQMHSAYKALAEAERAKREFIDNTSMHPWDGKKVTREQRKFKRFSSRDEKETLFGIVEVVRTTSKFSENLNWSRPRLGDVVVRKLKKDGTASLQMHKFFGGLETKWSLVEDAQ